MNRLIWIVLIFAGWHAGLSAQTCCSGGVPVSSHLGLAAQETGTLQVSLATDFILLRTLFAGDRHLPDAGRKRSTCSFLFRLAYNFTPRLTVETLLPYVRQSRTIESGHGVPDVAVTSGIGDAATLITYDLLSGPITARLGGGLRIPVGNFDTRNDQGVYYVEDLQAGSGAWDGLFFGSVEVTPGRRPSAAAYLNVIYRLTGTNTESRGGTQSYRFGNDLQLIAGYQDQYFAQGQVWNSGLGMRYRTVQRDAIDDFENTGTGGEFLFMQFNHAIVLGRHQVEANLELPLYRFVNETQLAPTVAFGLAWYTQISLAKKHLNPLGE